MSVNGLFSKVGDLRNFLFSGKDWAGFTWLLKILSIYITAATIITLLHEYTPARHYLAPLLISGPYPIYVLILGLLLGVPAFNLCRAAVARFPTKSRGLPILLTILALYCACVIIAQIILSRLLPVFTSALVVLFIVIILLLGLRGILKFLVKDVVQGMKK